LVLMLERKLEKRGDRFQYEYRIAQWWFCTEDLIKRMAHVPVREMI
jgi:hypothetical protein